MIEILNCFSYMLFSPPSQRNQTNLRKGKQTRIISTFGKRPKLLFLISLYLLETAIKINSITIKCIVIQN